MLEQVVSEKVEEFSVDLEKPVIIDIRIYELAIIINSQLYSLALHFFI
jgi:hypothetical protein